MSVAKQRNPRPKTLRKAIGKQLNFVKRDLKHIEELAEQGALESLNKAQYRQLLVIQELYRQQQFIFMYETKMHQVDDRMVSSASRISVQSYAEKPMPRWGLEPKSP